MKRAMLVGMALVLAGCMGPKPLKGGKATMTSKPAGVIEQTVVQSENPAQVSKQDQETVKVKTYTVPSGSRLEETRVVAPEAGPLVTNVQALVISAPMAVTEREETRAKTELGAAQKDTARELGAKLSSLKGIVWVGVALRYEANTAFTCSRIRKAFPVVAPIRATTKSPGSSFTRVNVSWPHSQDGTVAQLTPDS